RDVGELGELAESRLEGARGGVERGEIAAEQRVLIETLRRQPADGDGRRVLDEQRDVRDVERALGEVAGDLLRAPLALAQRLEIDGELALIRRCRGPDGRGPGAH